MYTTDILSTNNLLRGFILVLIAPTLFIGVAAQNSDISDGSSGSGVYALPEIHIKLQNGSVLQVEPNSPVLLAQDIGRIELSCTADYPIKWEYRMKNKTIPVLDIVYRRLIRNASANFNNPKRNRFMSLVTLRGLLESQSGKYICRHYNEKLDNNSYAVASHFDIFIPGNRTFNTVPTIEFFNKTAPYVSIHCPVSDPRLHVRLFKLNEKHFNITGEIVWKPIYSSYEPTEGFRLYAGLGRELLGTYNCTAENGKSILWIAADLSQKHLYQTSNISNTSCMESKLVQYIRSNRLECFCQDSFGLFMNANYEFQNRQASCARELIQEKLNKCADWRLDEFFANEEESSKICFREPIRFDGSGSRPSLHVKGKSFPDGDSHRKFPFSKLNITYNGFVDWAGDFMLAICRKQICQLSQESGNSSDLEYFENEQMSTQHFPMAHQQARWNDVVVNGTGIKAVYVFQAHSLSYAWFPYASVDIDWRDDEQVSGKNVTQEAGADSQQMISSSAGPSSLVFSKMTTFRNDCFLCIFLFFIALL